MKTFQTIAATLAVTLLAACGGGGTGAKEPAASAPKKTGEVIATVGDATITTDDFMKRMNEQSPFIRARYQDLGRKKEFLENMIRFEVLAQEAKRRGLDQDPDVVEATRKAMVQKLMKLSFEPSEGIDIPEEELRAYYEKNIEDYVKPERVRLSHIFFLAPKDSPERQKVKAEAQQILKELLTSEPVGISFAETARKRSDDAVSRNNGGDTFYKTREEFAEAWGQSFADEAFALTTQGKLHDKLVETDKGFHIVKLTGRQNAFNRDFEEAKASIQSRLYREKQTQAFDEMVARLKEQARVSIDEKVLESIEVNAEVGRPTAAGAQGGSRVIPATAPRPTLTPAPAGAAPRPPAAVPAASPGSQN